MKKKFLSIFTVLIILLVAVGLVACTDYTTPEEDNEEASSTSYTHTITNGTFYNASTTATDESGDKAILDTIPNWTQSSGSTTTAKDGKNGVLAGAINMSDATIFNEFANKYLTVSVDDEGNDLAEVLTMTYPGLDEKNIPLVDKLDDEGNVVYDDNGKAVKVKEDTNALVIASTEKEGSLYVKGSSSYTLEKDSRYLLQFSVCTMIDAVSTDADYANKGAWFIVKGDVEYVVPCINTNNQWKTYYLFVETNKYNSLSINVELWLGFGPGHVTSTSYADDGKDVYSTRGVALFDNVLCEKVEVEDLSTAVSSEIVTINNAYGYDAEKTAHDNFLNFKSAIQSTKDINGNAYVKASSAYYLTNASMELRSHVTSYTTNSYRKYFYTYRENYSSNNLSDWTLSTSESSLDKRYYGSVDLSKLYNVSTEEDTSEIKDNYSSLITDSYKFNAVSYDDWYNKVMRDANHNITTADESYALMLYNKDLQANKVTSSDKIIIEANTYYEISVWVYVWAKTYDGDFTYFDDFSSTLPTDPKTKFGTDETRHYYLYENNKIENYFVDLSDAEKTKAEAFDGSELGDYLYGNSASDVYKTETASWLRGLLNLQATDDVDSLIDNYYYTYLWSIKDSWSANLIALESALEKAYLAERKANYDVVKGLVDKIEEYEEQLEDYNIEKSAYDSKYQVWENNPENSNGPFATVSLTGVGEGIESTTTAMNQWQKVTMYVQGNQLSSRQLSLELALGTGSDYSTYMIGGAYFDNVEIVSYEADDAPNVEWNVLSEITDTNEISLGGLYGDGELTPDSATAQQIANDNWKVETVDGTASTDISSVKISVSSDNVGNVKIGTNEYNLYALSYVNEIPTASTLTYVGNNAIEVKPNKFYRVAFLIKTIGVDKDLGITIKLMKGEEKDEIGDVLDSTVTKYTNESETWAEVVYYVSGDIVNTYYLGLEIAMGSGSRFSTSSYVKGTVKISAFNCLEIDYDEYKEAATGDKIVKSLSLYNVSYDIDSAENTFGNDYYSKIDYENTDKDQFDENGKLVGIGTTDDWTITDGKDLISNEYTMPSNVAIDNNKRLTWDGVTGYSGVSTIEEVAPIHYEIWIKYNENGKSKEELFDIVDASAENDEYSYDIEENTNESENWVLSYFAVKAVGTDGVSQLSAYTTNAVGKLDGTVIPTCRTNENKAQAKAGTIIVANQSETLFGKVDGDKYVSPYPTLLKITSNYSTVLSAYSGSESLSADSYYKISVWVRTDVGTYASISIDGASGSLQSNTDSSQLGFVYVTTNGQWEEYCFYVKTSNFDASLYVKLSLGNPYATKKTGKVGSGTDTKTYYSTADMSKGSVYFDAVKITAIKENEFLDAKDADANKGADAYASKMHEYVYTSVPYYMFIMEYVLDSFDAYDESSSDELGNDPTNYTRGYDSDLTKDNTLATYGIYNYNSDNEKMINAIDYLYKYLNTDEESVYNYNNVFNTLFDGKIACENWGDDEWKSFMKEFLSIDRKDSNGNTVYEGGNNVLVMSNKAESGYAQNYTLDSSYNGTIGAGAYAKITFTARTLLARVIATTTKDENDKDVTTYSYATDEAFAEMRVIPDTSNDDQVNVKVNSYVYGEENDVYGAVTYNIYLYNKSESSHTVNWSFHLGGEPNTKEDATVFEKYLIGLLAVDLVSMETIDEAEYTSAKANNASTGYFYEYEEGEQTSEEEPDEEPDENEEETEDFWTKLFNNEYFWLYISSFIIAIAIIITIIAVLVNRWKKRHPKQVVGENIVKTEKDIKVVTPEPQVKEDALEADEYVDEIKPIYVQRTVNKGKKKKKKK